MALKSNNTAIAFKIQPTRNVFEAPNSTSDLLPFSQFRPSVTPVTIDNDEYTGSVWRNAADIAGKTFSATFTCKLRPPTSLPAANALVLGRLLQAAKFTELRVATAIPSSPEALGSWVNSKTPTLGASATGTADLYKGYPIKIGSGAYKTALTSIRSYNASKQAGLMQDWGSTPAVSYQIPTFIGYFRDITSADAIILSAKFWLDGHRFDIVDVGITGMNIVVPTSTDTQAAYPEIQFTISGTIEANSEEATPSITAAGAVPLYKDGKGMLDYFAAGFESVSIDLGVEAESPPNPNRPDGVDAPELAGGTASGTITMQKYLPSGINTYDLANAQAYHPLFMQWGSQGWRTVQVIIPDARLGFPSPDLSGRTMRDQVGLYIDVLNRNLGIIFPGA